MRKHRCLKNDYQFFDILKTKDRKISGNCNLLKVKVHELGLNSPSNPRVSNLYQVNQNTTTT